jgi:TPR repeat protein
LKNPARLAAPANMAAVVPPPNVQTPNVQTPGARSGTVVAMAPTREDITTAYQSALQGGRAPAAAAPPAAIAAPAAPVRRLDPDELATLLTRAKGLLAAGDIPPARLLLERAADAQDPTAAFMLAQTYDPAVLGTQDARNIIPDLEVARTWYQRAVQLGSAEAQRRLSQMQ